MTEPIHDLLTSEAVAAAPVLPCGFYQRPTEDVARDLLGKILVRATSEGVVAVRINEVEAYLGIEDPACHTFGGRRTPRTETMWGRAGVAYVYLIYGIHHCLNVVTVGEGIPEAVLLRGAEPVVGGHLIRKRRGPRVSERELTNGPGKLCQALAVVRVDDGIDLCGQQSPISFRTDGFEVLDTAIERAPRIGVDYAGHAAGWPLRFIDAATRK